MKDFCGLKFLIHREMSVEMESIGLKRASPAITVELYDERDDERDEAPRAKRSKCSGYKGSGYKCSGYYVEHCDLQSKLMIEMAINPLQPKPTGSLKFSTDLSSYEIVRSAGLSIKILKRGFMRSYQPTHLASWKDAVSYGQEAFVFYDWLQTIDIQSLKSKKEDFRVDFSCFILELTINDIGLLASHLLGNGRDPSRISSLKNGSTIGYLAFDEHLNDVDWLDVKSLYVVPCAQSLGLGTIMIRCILGLAISSRKTGVEFNNPFCLPGSASFYKIRGMNLVSPNASVRHREGCAQLRILNENGSLVYCDLLPKSAYHSIEFKKIPSPDPASLN